MARSLESLRPLPAPEDAQLWLLSLCMDKPLQPACMGNESLPVEDWARARGVQ